MVKGFERLRSLKIVNNGIASDGARILAALIDSSVSLSELVLENCSIGASGMLALLQAVLGCYRKYKDTLYTVEVDDVKLTSHEGLDDIPAEILKEGSKRTMTYLVDLIRARQRVPLYRTKLIAIGHESTGKTSILNCLFPLSSMLRLKTKKLGQKKEEWAVLQGSILRRYVSKTAEAPKREYYLAPGTWEVSAGAEELGFSLLDLKTRKLLECTCETRELRDRWLERLRKATSDSPTQGIEIRHHVVDNPLTEQYLNHKLELSAWDFAGQSLYFNFHHYFIASRAIYLVVWNMAQGDLGIRGLPFWFRSLRAHLPILEDKPEERSFTIIVVGTHLEDSAKVPRDEFLDRERKIKDLALSCGLTHRVEVLEVSCISHENISTLQSAVFSMTMSHSYIGEAVPEHYLAVEEAVEALRTTHREFPLIGTGEIVKYCSQFPLVSLPPKTLRKALSVLASWGGCIYFDRPESMAKTVVLIPEFLTKTIMAQLFNVTKASLFRNGVLAHSDLAQLWPQYESHSEVLMNLVEKFEICFRISEGDLNGSRSASRVIYEIEDWQKQSEANFFQQLSVFPSMLPLDTPAQFPRIWTSEPGEGEVQLERVFKFNVVPLEMISRLVVRLYRHVHRDLVWKTGIVIRKYNSTASVGCDMAKNRIDVTVRGALLSFCVTVMDMIVAEVEKIGEQYRGLLFRQLIKSRRTPDTLVSVPLALQSLQKTTSGYSWRTRKTTSEALPALLGKKPSEMDGQEPESFEALLIGAGILEPKMDENSCWWNLLSSDLTAVWSVPQNEDDLRTLTVSLEEDKRDLELPIMRRLLATCPLAGIPFDSLRKAVAVHNPAQFAFFEEHRRFLLAKQKAGPRAFDRHDWKNEEDCDLRLKVMKLLDVFSAKCPWNDNQPVSCLAPIYLFRRKWG